MTRLTRWMSRAHTSRLAFGTVVCAVAFAVAGCSGANAGGTESAVPTASDTSEEATASAAQDSTSATEGEDSSSSSASSSSVSASETADPTSLLVLVNKQHPLSPLDYTPSDLVTVTLSGTSGQMRSAAASALSELAAASDAATGATMTVVSAFRSYSKQESTYAKWEDSYGQAEADLVSARAGYSEHQTGLAVDIGEAEGGCSLDTCFGTTATGEWVASNAWQYGFIVRFPDGGTDWTGYSYEPWHLRYIGVADATAMHDAGIATLEQYLGSEPASDY